MKNAVRLLKIGGFRLIISMGFLSLRCGFWKSGKKFKNAVALFPFRSYKEMQGEKTCRRINIQSKIQLVRLTSSIDNLFAETEGKR